MRTPTRTTTSRARTRNLGVMAHVDAGKTTCSERILFLTGEIHRIGEVHHGQAELDHHPQEQARGITITAAAHTCEWDGYQINLIDTPGHVDFTVEVERSLRVLDGAIAVFDAVAGVEPQSETVWRQADRHGVPRVVFINKMDRPGADLDACIAEITDRLDAAPLQLQVPLHDGDTFVGIIDVLSGTVWRWLSDDPTDVEQYITPPKHLTSIDSEQLAARRQQLIDSVAELDEQLLDDWVRGVVDLDDVRAALRRLTVSGQVVPVLCGSALSGIGVQPLLDAVVDYLPSPNDVSSVLDTATMTEIPTGQDQPFSALAFKVVHGQGGKLTWIRVYGGVLAKGDKVLNASTGSSVRASRIVRLKAGRTADVEQVEAGDIAAVFGLGDTVTGHTLCDPRTVVEFESMEFPEPVMSIAVEPATSQDQEKLSVALSRVADEDPTFTVRTNNETGQTLIAGMGELHLQVVVDRLADDHGVELNTGQPEVAYRETIAAPVAGLDHKLNKQTGGPGMFARVVVDVEPTGSTSVGDLDFVNTTSGGVVPAEFAKAVADGALDALTAGPLGYPLVGIKMTLTDGAIHSNDSSERSFRIAGAQALRLATERAGTVLLEPVMAVEAEAPEEHLGAVIGSINSRRGEVSELTERNGSSICKAIVPLAELFGFTDAIRSVSQGRASATMTPAGYRPAP